MLRKFLQFLLGRCRRPADRLSEKEKLRIDMTQRCRCLSKRMW